MKKTIYLLALLPWLLSCSKNADFVVREGYNEATELPEARLGTCAHRWLPYDEPAPPRAARRFWARPALLAGWTF